MKYLKNFALMEEELDENSDLHKFNTFLSAILASEVTADV